LFVLVLVFGFFGLILLLPIVALRRIAELGRRVERLEAVVRQARPAAAPVAPPAAAAVRAAPPAAPVTAEAVEAEPLAVTPWRPHADAATLEAWIGRRGLGWVAVILLLFAAAFFIQYAFESRWLGELGRVACGVLAGVGLCVAGWRYHHRGWRAFSQM